MKLLAFILLLGAIVVGIAFHYHAGTREYFRFGFEHARGSRFLPRTGRIGFFDRDRVDAYRLGRELFTSKWAAASGASFVAWGDDPAVGSQHLLADRWIAKGKVDVTIHGTRARHPWAIVFDRAARTIVAAGFMDEADQIIDDVAAGRFTRTFSAAPGTYKLDSSGPAVFSLATSNPKPWIPKGSALDQPKFESGIDRNAPSGLLGPATP